MHRLLKRQLNRHGPGADSLPEKWQAFVDAIDDAYHQSDTDRSILERSLELSTEELNRANSELRAVFQALPDLFFRIDRHGTILEVRGASLQNLVAEPRQLKGKKLHDIPVPAVADKLAAAVREVDETEQLVSVEYELSMGEGVRFYEARLLPLLSDQIIVIVRNVTDKVEAERALAQKADDLARSNAELEQFAYVASHDLQEPLRTVQRYLQLLTRRYADSFDDDAHEFIDFTVDAATRMRQLIHDLLLYARVSSKAGAPETTDTMVIAQHVVASLGVAVQEANAEVNVDPLPTLQCDGRQIGQLLQNLIANAIKFRGDQPPRVEVSAEKQSHGWLFKVADNGIGIAPKYADKIFSIFQRLHAREHYAGTGIGLAVCKKIVERHGGRIWVESQPGEGTTFLFTLPQREPQ